MKITVLHIMNSISPTSSGYELACGLDDEKFKVIMVSFLGVEKIKDSRIINLESNKKLDFRAIKKLDRLMKTNKIHILHTHHNISGSIARIIAKKNRIPIIVDTEHGSHSRYKFFGNLFNDLTLFLSDKIVNVSKWVSDSYAFWEKIFIPRKKACIIYNGVNLEKIRQIVEENNSDDAIIKKFGINKEDKLFLHVARLTKVKNQYNLIKGFAQAAYKSPTIKLLIVGDGELRRSLQKLVNDLNMSNNIMFTGLISRKSVYYLMKQAYGFILNSYSEGLCGALLEAMAFRLPCILSNIPSFKETVKGNDIGEVIEKDSITEVTKAFERFLSTDNEILKKKGIAARRLVEMYYDFNLSINNYENLYLDLIKDNKL